MLKRLLALVIAGAMLFSVLLFSACKEKPVEDEDIKPIVLTPKEKMLDTMDAASSYFSELKSILGIETAVKEPGENQMAVSSMGIEMKKLSLMGTSFIEEPVGVSVEMHTDISNKVEKGLMEIFVGGTTIPIEMIVSSDAMFMSILKVTDKMIKIPYNSMDSYISIPEDFDFDEIAVNAQVYFDFFMDSLDDELFTEQIGTVTVDGIEIADAETITFKATEKQLCEALLAVFKKAEADLWIKSTVSGFFNNDDDKKEAIEAVENFIKDAIEELEKDIEDAKDDSYLILTTIIEKGSLRSIEFVAFDENEEKVSITLTTVVKDGTYYVKGKISYDHKTLMRFTYAQKANDKGSADGSLKIITYDYNDKITFSVDFKGEKTDNLLTIDADIKILNEYEGYYEDTSITVDINLLIEYLYISSEEMSISAELSIKQEELGVEVVIGMTGGYKLKEYEEIKVPSDNDTIVIDESFDFEALLASLLEEYPELAEFIESLEGFFEPPYRDFQVYFSEDAENTIYLYDDEYGSFSTTLYNVSYANGIYSAEMSDGTTLTGTYSLEGDRATIDGIEGYSYMDFDGLPFISNYEYEVYIDFYEGGLCRFSTDFYYYIDGNTIYIELSTGGEMSFEYIDYGDYFTIDGVKYTSSY